MGGKWHVGGLYWNIDHARAERKEQKQVEISSPSVNVEVNQEKVVNSLSELSRDLLEELRKFNNKPIPISFEVKTDNWNNLRTVNIQYSTSDKLNYKK